jgi:hypothetical protein
VGARRARLRVVSIPCLEHGQRVEAVSDHVHFFSTLDPTHLDRDVPTCPDWTVEGVLRHVWGGARTVCLWVEQAGDPGLDTMSILQESHGFASTAPVDELTQPLLRYVELLADDVPVDVVAGEGQPQAVLGGSARDILMFLWRRPNGPVSVEGDPTTLGAHLDRVV